MTFLGIIAVITAAFAIAYLVFQAFPELSSTLIGTLETFRAVIGALMLAIVVWHFLLSGDKFQVFVAFLALVLSGLYFFVFQPHKEVI